MFLIALLASAIGYILGRVRGADADYSAWQYFASRYDVHNLSSFVRGAYNASYLGELIGLVIALLLLRKQIQGIASDPRVMDNLTAHPAADYDQKVGQTIPFYNTIHAEVLRLVKLIKPEAQCWLDTGCGTGRVVQQALESFPATRFLLGDPSEAMLGQARARFANQEVTRVQILPPCGSADLLLHVNKSTADIVTAIQCHHYLTREARLAALRSCCEVLKPGGLLVTFENVAPRTAEGVRLGLAAWKSFLMENGRTEAEADKQVERYGREFLPITVEEHLAALTQTGFSVVELFWYSHIQAGSYAIH